MEDNQRRPPGTEAVYVDLSARLVGQDDVRESLADARPDRAEIDLR